MCNRTVDNGLLSCVTSLVDTEVSGANFVKIVTEYCATDFEKKIKLACRESRKAMIRLQKECEVVVRSLSSKGEVSIDIDSLYEGVDYSTKISRARFEDLSMNVFTKFRNDIFNVLSTASMDSNSIDYVSVAGGSSYIPRLSSIVKDLFPNAATPSGHVDPIEVLCVGAMLWGRYLKERVRVLLLYIH